MTALYSDIATLRASPVLLIRFIVAIETAVYMIFTEPVGTANHANRILWAKRAFFTSDAAQRYADLIRRIACVSDQGLQTNGEQIADAAIQTIVNTYVDQLATANL